MSISAHDKEPLWQVKNPGFLLTEILVSLLIVVGLSTVVIHYQWQSAQWYHAAARQAQALAVASNAIESYILSGILQPKEEQNKGIKISWTHVDMDVTVRAPFVVERKDLFCRLMRVQTRWHMAKKEHSVTLVTGKTNA